MFEITIVTLSCTDCVSLVIIWMSSASDLFLKESRRQWITYSLG